MSGKYDNVIVFGPTGDVGGHTALKASKRGAKVWLALRDPSKPIDAIPADVEKAGKFARVQADLSDPISVGRAIEKSGAKAAYLYLVHGSTDHMRGTLQALKDAGVEYIVFLSSGSVGNTEVDPHSVPPKKFIPYVHAQAEISVEEVGFPYVTILRPWGFASNHFKLNLDRSVKPPKANIVYLDAKSDNIVPEDIGAVGGAVLVDRPSNGKEIIVLHGPELKKAEEAWAIIKRVTGRDDIDTTPLSEDEFYTNISKFLPAPVAKYLTEQQAEWRYAERWVPEAELATAKANVKKYTGREATKFEDYVEAHKAEWQAL
ncbi:hypothetical protein SLS53_001726 [Cytospora paraplurivora]|uniref:NAD(P)-binding domain-containing protein n=1 Tax=Cytospora paraplurivora TaxID=2898453 RepID=A0AAN9YKJ5_9PEZI